MVKPKNTRLEWVSDEFEFETAEEVLTKATPRDHLMFERNLTLQKALEKEFSNDEFNQMLDGYLESSVVPKGKLH